MTKNVPIVKHLDLSRKASMTQEGTVTVKLALSNAEAGALRVKVAQDGRMQADVDPVTGVVTITGDPALVQAALQDVQLAITHGFNKTFKLDVHVAHDGGAHHEQVILYFESASGLHVPIGKTGSNSTFNQTDATQLTALSHRHLVEASRQGTGHGTENTARSIFTQGDGNGTDGVDGTVVLTLPPLDLRPGNHTTSIVTIDTETPVPPSFIPPAVTPSSPPPSGGGSQTPTSPTASSGSGGGPLYGAGSAPTLPSPLPVLTGLDSSVTFLENTINAAASIIDSMVVVTDDDSLTFGGGSITVSLTAGAAQDQLTIRNQGMGAGQIGNVAGTVYYGGLAIGTITGNGVNGANLSVSFNSNATPTAVSALITNMMYQNTSDTPNASRTANIVINDGAGHNSVAQSISINVTAENDAPTGALTLNDHARASGTGAGAYTFNTAAAFTDVDGVGMTYSVTAITYGTGAPSTWSNAGFITINSSTGLVSNNATLAANTVFVTVTATDGGGLSYSTSYDLYIPSGGVLNGTAGNDNLNPAGTAGNDQMWGDDGNDTLDGLGGNDTIHSGSGEDSINDASGNNLVFGGSGNDTLVTGANNDTMYGGTGNDSITSANGGDILYGGQGNDTMLGQNNNDSLYGQENNDSLVAGSGNDMIFSGTGADTLVGGADGDGFSYTLSLLASTLTETDIINDFTVMTDILQLIGFGGVNDIFAGAPTSTSLGYTFDGTYTVITDANSTFALKLLGSIGLTRASFSFNGVINGLNGAETITGTNMAETINGYGGDDSIWGNGQGDFLYGGTGNDTLRSSNSNNTPSGDAGDDSIIGGTLIDFTFGGDGNDTIQGNAGDDVMRGENGADSLDGGAGNDGYSYTSLGESVVTAEDTIASFTQTSDIIRLFGMGITGVAAGAPVGSVLGYAFDGTYTVITHATSTFSIKLVGNYTLSISDFNLDDTITGTAGGDTINGTEFVEVIYGLDGNDSLGSGRGVGDSLYGGNNDDTITSGGSSSNRLYGENGNDSLVGNGNSNHFTGGSGVDTMTGGNNTNGAASDSFIYTAATDSGIGAGLRDIITDFSQGALEQDIINLSALTGLATFRVGGGGVGDFVGGFQVAYQQVGGNTIVMVDTNGNNATDFEIELTGLYTLVAGDFIL